jgi:hypothetical protein
MEIFADMKSRFKDRRLQQMYEDCIRIASDNFGEFYYGDGRTDIGPRFQRTGAGHRAAFWNGYRGTPNHLYPRGSFAAAAYRAGIDFKKGARA